MQLNSVSFTLNDPAASDNAAIVAAGKDAERKAQAVASSMGVKLGKALSISTNAQVQPQIIYGNVLRAAMSGAANERRANEFSAARDPPRLAARTRRRRQRHRGL
jgi:uncharacterized protein YggE